MIKLRAVEVFTALFLLTLCDHVLQQIMNIYRNTKDQQLYLLYKVTPRSYTGGWYEAEHLQSHQIHRVSESKLKYFVAAYHL